MPGEGTFSMLGDTYVPPLWPPYLTFWGLNTILFVHFFSSINTKTIFLGTNPSRIRSFWPQIPFLLRSFRVQFQWPVAHPYRFSDRVHAILILCLELCRCFHDAIVCGCFQEAGSDDEKQAILVEENVQPAEVGTPGFIEFELTQPFWMKRYCHPPHLSSCFIYQIATKNLREVVFCDSFILMDMYVWKNLFSTDQFSHF